MALPDYEGWAMFAAVADAGSFGGAAAALGVSPASVSKAVARLEGALGLALFHRTTRRVALSTAGQPICCPRRGRWLLPLRRRSRARARSAACSPVPFA